MTLASEAKGGGVEAQPQPRFGTDQAPLFTGGYGPSGLTYHGITRSYSGLTLALCGSYQADNSALALAAVELLGDRAAKVSAEGVRVALAAVRWPGRLELLADCRWQGKARAVLLDGAHNPAGVESLLAALSKDFRFEKLIMVWASMGDKDFQSCVRRVEPLCHRLIFTRPESARSATPTQLRLALTGLAGEKCLSAPTVPEALTLAYDLAGPQDLICVAGSLYLVGKARSILVGDLVDD